METTLRGKIAWVTGASRGIGHAVALGLAAAGAKVAIMARDSESLQELARKIGEADGEALVVAGSVASGADVKQAIRVITESCGGVDILVNCAGISPILKAADKMSEKEWREIVDVNLTGTFLCCQAAYPPMLSRGGGSIVNMSSIHDRVGVSGLTAYAASKGGISVLTACLALEWASKDIRVNCIRAGYFATDMTAGLRRNLDVRQSLLSRVPMGRFGEPSELVPAVLYLASEASSFVTGAAFAVDGGWTAG